MAVSKTASRKSAAKKAAKTRKSRTAAKKAAATRKQRVAGKKAAITRKRRVAAKKAVVTRKTNAAAALVKTVGNTGEIDARIAIARNNLRDLVEQAASYSGAADEERMSQRIADQEAKIERLKKQRGGS